MESLMKVLSDHLAVPADSKPKRQRSAPSTLNKYSLAIQRQIRSIERGDAARSSVSEAISAIPPVYREALYDRIDYLSRLSTPPAPKSAPVSTPATTQGLDAPMDRPAKKQPARPPSPPGPSHPVPQKRKADEQAAPLAVPSFNSTLAPVKSVEARSPSPPPGPSSLASMFG